MLFSKSRILILILASLSFSAQAKRSDANEVVNKALHRADEHAISAQGQIDPAMAENVPLEIQRDFAELRGRPAEETKQICDTLLNAPARSLVPLEPAILDPENKFLDECREQLHERLENLYEEDRRELELKHGPLKNPEALIERTERREVARNFCYGKIGNNPVIEIETQRGPAYGAYQTPAMAKSHPHQYRKPPGLAPKEIIVTLDDGPVPRRTQKALIALEEHCVQATFFLIGQQMQVPGGQALVQRELDGGHGVGDHTWSHPANIARLSEDKQIMEVIKQWNLVSSDLAKFKKSNPENAARYVHQPFFRFPGGNESVPVLNYLKANNIASFTWQAGANDWYPHQSAEMELQEALREIAATKGGIFLIHDTYQATVDMLPYLLEELTKRGYKIRHMVPKHHGD